MVIFTFPEPLPQPLPERTGTRLPSFHARTCVVALAFNIDKLLLVAGDTTVAPQAFGDASGEFKFKVALGRETLDDAMANVEPVVVVFEAGDGDGARSAAVAEVGEGVGCAFGLRLCAAWEVSLLSIGREGR
jgi:hypothetical protein